MQAGWHDRGVAAETRRQICNDCSQIGIWSLGETMTDTSNPIRLYWAPG